MDASTQTTPAATDTPGKTGRLRRFAMDAIAAAALVAALWGWWSGAADGLLSRESVEAAVQGAGPWGPALVVVLITVAVVASPLPSAPIAVVAGAAYGHVLGTALVAAGAETGAIIAYLLARYLGRGALRRWLGDKVDIGLLGSQNALMVTIFLSRLMPFVSFDMVSYGAGLTRLNLWRFAVATLAGILPASFVLAHMGGEITATGASGSMTLVLGLGLVTGLPLIWAAWKRNAAKNGQGAVEPDQGTTTETG